VGKQRLGWDIKFPPRWVQANDFQSKTVDFGPVIMDGNRQSSFFTGIDPKLVGAQGDSNIQDLRHFCLTLWSLLDVYICAPG
jgi:hypothetical protein